MTQLVPSNLSDLAPQDLATILRNVTYPDILELCSNNIMKQKICSSDQFWYTYFELNYPYNNLKDNYNLSWQQKVSSIYYIGIGPVRIFDIVESSRQLTFSRSKIYNYNFKTIISSNYGLLLLSNSGEVYFIPKWDLSNFKYDFKTGITFSKINFEQLQMQKILFPEKITQIASVDYRSRIDNIKFVQLFLTTSGRLIERKNIYDKKLHQIVVSESEIIYFKKRNIVITKLFSTLEFIFVYNSQHVYRINHDVSMVDMSDRIGIRKFVSFTQCEIKNIWDWGEIGIFYLCNDGLYFKDRYQAGDPMLIVRISADKIWIYDSLLYIYNGKELHVYIINYDENLTLQNTAPITLSFKETYIGTRIATVYTQRKFPLYFTFVDGIWNPVNHGQQGAKYLSFLKPYVIDIKEIGVETKFYPELVYDLGTVVITKYTG